MTDKQRYVWILRPIYMIAPCKGLQGWCSAICSQPNQKHRGEKPLLLTISVLGSVTCITQHTETYSFTSHPKDEAITVKCLAQGHKCRYRESNPHSGFLTTPEPESGALDRPAMTLHEALYTAFQVSEGKKHDRWLRWDSNPRLLNSELVISKHQYTMLHCIYVCERATIENP